MYIKNRLYGTSPSTQRLHVYIYHMLYVYKNRLYGTSPSTQRLYVCIYIPYAICILKTGSTAPPPAPNGYMYIYTICYMYKKTGSTAPPPARNGSRAPELPHYEEWSSAKDASGAGAPLFFFSFFSTRNGVVPRMRPEPVNPLFFLLFFSFFLRGME